MSAAVHVLGRRTRPVWTSSLRQQTVELVLRAYVDESGKADSDFLAVAGAISSPDAWSRFETRWGEVLRYFGAPALHMRTFAHSTKEFAAWKGDEQKRQDFLAQLMQVALETVDGFIGAVVDVRVFRALDKAEQAIHDYDPYWPCLQDCFSVAANHAVFRGADEQVEILVEEQQGLAAKATSLFARYKAATQDPAMVIEGDPAEPGRRLAGISVRSKRDCVQFQVADWVAYEITKEAKALAMGAQRPPKRWPFQQFMSHRGFIHVYGTKEELLKKSPLGAPAAGPR